MATKGTESLPEDQVKLLEENFTKVRHPDGTTLMLIAAECGLSEEETLVSNTKTVNNSFLIV